MTNAADPRAVAKARRIHNAQHAKAVEIAPYAEALVRTAGGTEEDLMRLPDAGWLWLAREAGKAGRDGTDVPSPTTKAMVINLVANELKET